MKKSQDSIISVAIKGTLLAATALAAEALEFDPETLSTIKRGCDLMLGWSINRLTSNVDQLHATRGPSLEELELNGHLVRLAGKATVLVLQSEIRDRELGVHFDEKSLRWLERQAPDNWLEFPNQAKLGGQSFTQLVTFKAVDKRVEGVFTSAFWIQFIEFSLQSSKAPKAASPDFVKSLAGIMCRKFPSIYFELAKVTAERDPQTFASIQLHFLGAIRHGQQQTDQKIDRLYELVIASVGKTTGGLKSRQITRLSQSVAKLYTQFEDLRPFLERLPANYQKGLEDTVRAVNRHTTVEAIRTRALVSRAAYVLLACIGVVLAVQFVSIIRQDQMVWERNIRDQKYGPFLNEIAGIDRLPPAERARVFDAARRRLAESLGIPPEDVEGSLLEDAKSIAGEAEALRDEFLGKPQAERHWEEVFGKYLKAGDLAQAAQDSSLASSYFEKALSLAETLGDKVEQSKILMKQADAAYEGNHLSRAEELYEAAVKRAEESGDLTARIDAMIRLVNHLHDVGNVGVAKARSDALMGLIQEGGEQGTLPSHALLAHGKVLRTLEQPADALKILERAHESHSRSCTNPACERAPEFLLELADTHYEIGHFDKAAEFLAEARTLIPSGTYLEVQALSLSALILLSRNLDETEPEAFAQERFQKALAEAQSAVNLAKKNLPGLWILQVNALQTLAGIQGSQEAGAAEALKTVETAQKLVISHEGENSRESAWLAYRAGNYARRAGKDAEAAKYLKFAANVAGILPASDPLRPKLIEAYLGDLLRKQDIQSLEKTLADLEEANRESTQPRPFSEMELEMVKGVIALYSNQSDAADRHFRLAEELATKSPDIGREFVLLNQMLRGMSQAVLGENPQGAALVQQAIAALGEIKGLEKGWRDQAETLEAAATMPFGGAEKSVPFYERKIREQRDQVGERHISIAGLLFQLGRAYYSVGREDEALKSLEEMKSILVERKDDWDVVAASGAMAYGSFLVEQERPQEAIFLIDQSARHLIRLMGKDAWLTGMALLSQSKLELALKDYESARQTGKQALETLKVSGMESPRDLLQATLPYAMALMNLGAVDEAGGLLKETATELAKGPFPSDTGVALDLWRLADALIVLEQFAEARPLIDQALEMDRKLFPEGLGTARDLNLRSLLSFKEGNLADAEREAREGLLIISRNTEASKTKDEISADLRRNYQKYLESLEVAPAEATGRIDRLLKGQDTSAPAPPKGTASKGSAAGTPKSSP